MNREEFQKYIDHFNARRYDDLVTYFTDDVSVEYFTRAAGDPKRVLSGPEGFMQSYLALHAQVREVLELGFFIADGDQIAVELYTEFHALHDGARVLGRELSLGEAVVMTNWVVYDLEGGRFKRIRIAHFTDGVSEDARLAPAELLG